VAIQIPALEMTIATVLQFVPEIVLYFRTSAVKKRLVEWYCGHNHTQKFWESKKIQRD